MLFILVASVLVLLVVARLITNALTPGLSSIPGPFLARFSDLWKLFVRYRNRTVRTHCALHKKYGSLVRIGPNTVSISDPRVIESIYGLRNDFPKSDHVLPWQNMQNGKVVPSLLTVQDKAQHAALRRPVANAYSMTTLTTFEPFVDDTIRYFLQRLDEVFMRGGKPGKSCDIDKWLQYFAYDTVGELAFSHRLDFLEQGGDIDGTLRQLDQEFAYRIVVGEMPWLDRFLKKNPIFLYFYKPSSKFMIRARQFLQRRMDQGATDGYHSSRRDFLSRFIEARKAYPDTVTDQVLVGYVSTPLLAGSDTTAVVLRTIIYYVLKNDRILTKLQHELDAARLEFPVSWKRAQDLPYLDAVVKEAIRIHPVGGGIMARVVPAGGLQLPDGRTLPPSTVVGMSGWSIHRDKGIYGEDAGAFAPERWLQGTTESKLDFERRLGAMTRTSLSWGYGTRSCLGKHVANLEIYKVIPTLFGLLNMRLVDPQKDWKVEEGFFTKQSDMDISVSWRDGLSLRDLD